MLNMLDVAIGFSTVMLAVSLIIMSITQAIASVAALRGAKLRRGLEELIRNALPTLAGQAKDLSKRMVQHPLISDSAAFTKARWSWASAIRREEIIPVLNAVLKESGLDALADNQEKLLEDWFDSFMARVSQWFVMNTRWITIVLAVVIAFGMHLDSIAVLKQIQTDSATRAKLSAMSASLLDQTPDALKRVEAVYAETVRKLVTDNPARFKENAGAEPLTMASRTEAANWIHEQAKSPVDAEALVTQFNAAVNDRLSEALDKSIDRAKTLQADLTSAGILVYPGPEHHWRHWTELRSPHFWGMAASVLFLSLGAPFWFNVLKNMSSLRSAVAQKASPPETRDARARSFEVSVQNERRLPALPPRPPQANADAEADPEAKTDATTNPEPDPKP